MLCIVLALAHSMAATILPAVEAIPMVVDGSLIRLGTIVFLFAGMWLLTGRRPDEDPLKRRWNSFPLLTRYVVAAAIVLSIAILPVRSSPGWLLYFADLVNWLSFYLMCWVFSGLAKWARHNSLARHFQLVFFILLIPGLSGALSFGSGDSVGPCFCFNLIALVVGNIWYLMSVVRLLLVTQGAVAGKARHDIFMRSAP